MIELSKYLCLLLRHQLEKTKLDMDEHGWVSVEQIIDEVNKNSSYNLDRILLKKVVVEDNMKRYNSAPMEALWVLSIRYEMENYLFKAIL